MTDAAPIPQDLLAHAAFVRRLTRFLLLDPSAAEDIEQETWRAALEQSPHRDGDLRTWLARVARNFARRRWRSEMRRRDREHTSARSEVLPSTEATLAREESLQRVVDAVRWLDEPYRSTILARFYEDLPPREIAVRAGIPVATVNTRLKRGLALLRTRLARDASDWPGSLGLLCNESPCLPTGDAVPIGIALMQMKTILVAAAVIVATWCLWKLFDLD